MARMLVPDLGFGSPHAFALVCAALLMLAAECRRGAGGWAVFWGIAALVAGLAMQALAQVEDVEEDDRDGC